MRAKAGALGRNQTRKVLVYHGKEHGMFPVDNEMPLRHFNKHVIRSNLYCKMLECHVKTGLQGRKLVAETNQKTVTVM